MKRLTLGSLVLAVLLVHLATMAGAQPPMFDIGVTFARVNGEMWVDSVVKGSPADTAGLRVGDWVVSVNDTLTLKMTEADVAASLRGARGTTVRLMISAPDNKLHTVEVPRSLPVVGGTGAASATPPPGRTPTGAPAGAPAAPPRAAAPQAAALPAPVSSGATPASVSFVNWVEPKEHSFSLEVPQGWNVTGGLNWVGPQEQQPFVRALSPDGKLQIFIGDADMTTRQVPTPISVAQNRAREGAVFRTPSGDPVLMQRYMPGSQFARLEVTTRHCPNARWLSEGDRPDLARAVATAVQPEATKFGMTASASAGDTGFTCDAREGYAVAVTVLVTANGAAGALQAWLVQGLGVFLSADPMRSMQTRYIMEHMLGTQKYDPQWNAAYEQRVARTTGSVMSMQNAEFQVQQGAARSASNTLSMLNHPNQGVSVRPGQRPSSSVNTTLGTRDMCDAIGRCKTVSLDAGAVFIDHSGNVVPGTSSGAPPDNSGVWSPMYQR